MPRVERIIEIKAPRKRVFDILDDTLNMPKWNIVVNEISEVKPGTYFAKTNVGDTTAIRTETVEPEKISTDQEGSLMTSMGYVLTPKGDGTEAMIWAEFDNPDDEMVLGSAGLVFLKSLKAYAEYLEQGKNPDEYNKKDYF
jgi:hypothetical protein